MLLIWPKSRSDKVQKTTKFGDTGSSTGAFASIQCPPHAFEVILC